MTTKKLCVLAILFSSLATAKEIVEEKHEELEAPHPVVEKAGWQWFLWSMGFLLGVVIELGTNTHTLWPCLGQPSDVAESVYFTYFYLRDYFENGYKTSNITYVGVYIARGIEAVMYGPCWMINEDSHRNAEKKLNEEIAEKIAD